MQPSHILDSWRSTSRYQRIANYNEDVLLLVIPTMTYSEMVLVLVGSKIIDRALSLMTKGELAKVTMTVEATSFWSCHVWVTAAIPHKLKQNWSGRRK